MVVDKKWYASKLVWLGVIETVIGIHGLVATFLGAGSYTPESIVVLVMGALTVALRVWFTDTPIE